MGGTDEIGCAVIGLGRIGRVHAANLARAVHGARLLTVCDVDAAACERVAAELRVAACTAPEAVFARDDVEVVVIATTTASHPELIAAAARAGKAVFAEKPVALTQAASDGALREVVEAGVAFQIGFQRRWDAAYLLARQQIEAGAIGRPRLFRAIGRDPAPAPIAYHDPASGGGIFLDAAIHDFDAARFLLGGAAGNEAVRVLAHGANLAYPELAAIDDLDTCVTLLDFADGALGVCEWNRFAGYGEDVFAEVQGTEGTLRLGGTRRQPLLTLSGGRAGRELVSGFGMRFAEAFRDELQAFVDALRSGRAPRPGVEDARRALQIALCARRSFVEQRRIEFDPLPPLTAAG
ncbi:MAG TPA: Gfo/Idh/MocA family oxidoreductase [Dehalococcoidia bacterium]|nr:Gfo/Idh/MocA family oxidoreductase [Dehalococcoidia bacterium]